MALAELGRNVICQNGPYFLEHIRVKSIEELQERILRGIAESTLRRLFTGGKNLIWQSPLCNPFNETPILV